MFDIKGILDPIVAIINKVVPDKTQAAAAAAQLQTMALQGQLAEEMANVQAATSAQSDIDKVEASSTSVLVSGWRPFVGWVCGAGFALIFVIGPMLVWITSLFGHTVAFPSLDSGTLMTLLFGLLGMGTLRTVDKVKGVASK